MAAELSEVAMRDPIKASEQITRREKAVDAWNELPWGGQFDPDGLFDSMRQGWFARAEAAFRAGYEAGMKDARAQAGVITKVDHATGTATIGPEPSPDIGAHITDEALKRIQELGKLVRDGIEGHVVNRNRIEALEQRAEKLSNLDAHQVSRLTVRVRELERLHTDTLAAQRLEKLELLAEKFQAFIDMQRPTTAIAQAQQEACRWR